MSFSLNSYDYKCYEAPDHVTDTERFPHSNAQRRPLALLQLLQFKFPISNTFRQDRLISQSINQLLCRHGHSVQGISR